jgi:uncharacterized protein YoxC
MFIDIILLLAIIIFAVLTYVVIRTLLVVQESLRKLNFFMDDMEVRMEKVDPLIQAVSNVGEICEEKTAALHHEFIEKKKFMDAQENPQNDVTDWLLLSLILVKKFLKRR